MSLTRYSGYTLPQLLDEINRYSLGFNGFLDQVYSVSRTYDSFPLENVIQEAENRLRVELALAGFDRSDLKVYTENGKLYVEGSKESKTDETYLKRRLAQRNFKWVRILPDHMQVENVSFINGLLTITLNRHVPEHEKRKDYSI